MSSTYFKNGLFALIIGVPILATIGFIAGPYWFARSLSRDALMRQRVLLYQIDTHVLESELRDFAMACKWQFTSTPAGETLFYADNDLNGLPPSIRMLKPTFVAVDNEGIRLDIGNAFLSFGIEVFRPGVAGHGTKRLHGDAWYYSDSGRIPTPD